MCKKNAWYVRHKNFVLAAFILLIIGFAALFIWLYFLEILKLNQSFDLFFQSTIAASLVFLVHSNSRQTIVDSSAISINPYNESEGIFELSNAGELPLNVCIEKAVLNAGKIADTTEGKPDDFMKVFDGIIQPKQNILFHSFDLSLEETYVFKGLLRLGINSRGVLSTKVRFAGSKAESDDKIRNMSHPHKKWIIYAQSYETYKDCKVHF